MRRRAFAAIMVAGAASVAGAQMLAGGTIGSTIRGLEQQNLLPTKDPGNPLQPSGFGEETDKRGVLPQGSDTDDQAFQIIRAGTSRQEKGIVEIHGGTEFLYHGYHVFADQVEGSLDSQIFTMSGDVMIIGKDAVISGDRVSVDFDKKIFHAVGTREDLKPSLVGGAFIKDLYAHGRDSYGSQNQQEILFGGITSCDLLHPHYEIDADDIEIKPAKRAIFRKARIKLFGRTILKIPFIEIPLDDRSYNNMPIVGQSPQEGYYAKFRYGIPLRGDNDLYTHIDLMSKLGLGIGADYLYQTRTMNGILQVYSILGPGEMMKVTDQHKQVFSWGTLSVQTDYENNNYLVNPGGVNESTRALLTFPGHGNSMTKLSINQSGSSQNGLSATSQEISLSNTQNLTPKISTSTNLDYQNNGTTYQGLNGPSTQTTQVLNVKEDVSDDLTQAVADLQYQRQIPIGSTQAVYGTTDETPVVTLSSDSKRLASGEFAQNWPFKTYFSIGQFSDILGDSEITRDAVDLAFSHISRGQSPLQTNLNGEFRQGIYSDGTAQYILNLADTESYKVGQNSSINFHYNYLRPYGYSPLAIDQTGQQNAATADFSVKTTHGLSVGAQTGFDLLRLQQSEVAWQPVGVRVEYTPRDYFLFRTQAMYDTIDGAWSTVQMDLSYKPGATFLSVGTYYDGIRHTWSNINVFLDGLTIGKMKLSAILNWDGFTNQFDNQQYSVTYDLHCAEAVFTMIQQQTGFNPGTSFQFFIRLKAFPFNSPFGAGSRGQPLGTGTGTSF